MDSVIRFEIGKEINLEDVMRGIVAIIFINIIAR